MASLRTIRSDLDFMGDRLSAPLEYKKNRGWHYTDPNWRLPSISLSQGEIFALTLGARMLSAYAGSAYVKEIATAINRLSERLPDKTLVDLQQLADERIMFGAGAEIVNSNPQIWQQLQEATSKSRQVWISYYAATKNTKSERTIDPYLLNIYRGTNPYVIAYCHLREDLRDFRIDRIQQLKVLETTFKRDPNFDPQKHLANRFQYESGDRIYDNEDNITIPSYIQTEVGRTLTEERLQQVVDARLNGNKLRPFQIRLAESKIRVTLARAGCGTGKTLGAYNWAKSQAVGRKLIFCYPTTGTRTEGFLDYVHNKLDSVLLHSRADVDLAMATTEEENEAGEDNNEGAIKLESFKAWGRESIVCTVDTVLGWLQCNRRPIYCFPAIAQAAFVFDEVHCYDEALFGALLRFLETVKAPILLMSASFLPWQKKAIEQAVSEPIELIPGDSKLEALPRYKFHYKEHLNWDRVERELADGGKVLWVCNQVKTAIAVYKEAKKKGLNAVLYHSRYRYQDRVKHHRAVVDGFKRDEPILAIATQVAEMSLDLSATLLVSQIADPAGLIQRLGRLNRHYCDRALDALFYPDRLIERVKNPCPYSKKQLDDGLKMIQSFKGEASQSDLAQWLENLNERGEPETDSVLLDGKWRTYPTSLRKEGFNITVLLEQDIETIKTLSAREIPRYTVPIPARDYQNWDKYKSYPIAPTEIWSYTSELGAEEIKQVEDKAK